MAEGDSPWLSYLHLWWTAGASGQKAAATDRMGT
jgi:hypothetical protein